MKYRLKEDAELAVISESEMICYRWPFGAGSLFQVIVRERDGRYAILGQPGKRVYVSLEQLRSLFEEVWETRSVFEGKWRGTDGA